MIIVMPPQQSREASAPALVKPITRLHYDVTTKERGEDGLGPFCGSYEGYLALVEKHNAGILAGFGR